MENTVALIPGEISQYLDRVRQTVKALQAEPCDLAHEAIVFDRHIAVRRSQGIGLDPVLVRCGICPAQRRMNQLSCAHTTARLKLARAVDAMVDNALLEAEKAKEIKSTLEEASVEIFRMDETLNRAESEYALLIEHAMTTGTSKDEEVFQHKEKIQCLKTRHRHIVGRLNAISVYLMGCFEQN